MNMSTLPQGILAGLRLVGGRQLDPDRQRDDGAAREYLAVLAGDVADLVGAGAIRHALRVTVSRSRRAYVYPARHFASSETDPSLPRMGERLRLKAGTDISHLPRQARIVAQALKTYGLIVADNGSSWFISGAPNRRWDNDQLARLRGITGRDFEVVDARSLSPR